MKTKSEIDKLESRRKAQREYMERKTKHLKRMVLLASPVEIEEIRAKKGDLSFSDYFLSLHRKNVYLEGLDQQ